MTGSITPDMLAALNPNILKYPCRYFGNGLMPLPGSKGYQYQHGKTVIRSKMDLGLATMRRRARTAPAEFTLTFKFTGEQKEVFESWVFNELDGGVEWFYLPLRTGDYDLEPHKCQFTATPGEDSPFKLLSMRNGYGSVWELKAKVQAFRAMKLERYTSRVLSRDTLSGLEKAALLAEVTVNDTPDI
ncbi:hypothetical protein [Photobacterium ganghwense]|uniref:hypothetical protein n=1 Tax=Photobacterium ganghwense TaxID=320778 RepID=UPI001C2DBCBB|nr:hypothetical protein [Photobacterium ganghwense]MBV1842703.1 hypothetical protein [Photobacterium ganghwense]